MFRLSNIRLVVLRETNDSLVKNTTFVRHLLDSTIPPIRMGVAKEVVEIARVDCMMNIFEWGYYENFFIARVTGPALRRGILLWE